MKLRTPHRLAALSLVTLAGVGAALHGARAPARVDAAIVAAAEAFLATLDDAARARALRPFEDQERFNWNFVPIARNGLPLADMTLEQRAAALALLQRVTSSQGYLKATGVMRLEEILGILENRPERRDPEQYFFWIFGTPSPGEPWGWRFEGHHISLNFTSVSGLTVTTPSFLGANPAQVRSGPHSGWRLLAAEEDLARELLLSLDAGQRAAAVIAAEAPSDIITGRDRQARLERTEGLAVDRMTAAQRELLLRVLAEYVGNMDPEIAARQMERIRAAGVERLHFAWAGSLEPGQGHYYRIHGPTVLIEYDNTQSNANHVHSVWRDLEHDFGEDLLRAHYETAGADHGHEHAPARDHGPDRGGR